MTREQIKSIFPEVTDEQLTKILDINSNDIGKAKGEFEKVKDDLTKANQSIKDYEKTVSDLKKDIENGEDFKTKFLDLEKKIADEKAENERKEKENQIEAEFKSRFDTIVGENKWRDELTGNAVYQEFKNALTDENNKGKGDKEIFELLTKDKSYYINPNPPADMQGMGGVSGATISDNDVRSVMGLPPVK